MPGGGAAVAGGGGDAECVLVEGRDELRGIGHAGSGPALAHHRAGETVAVAVAQLPADPERGSARGARLVRTSRLLQAALHRIRATDTGNSKGVVAAQGRAHALTRAESLAGIGRGLWVAVRTHGQPLARVVGAQPAGAAAERVMATVAHVGRGGRPACPTCLDLPTATSCRFGANKDQAENYRAQADLDTHRASGQGVRTESPPARRSASLWAVHKTATPARNFRTGASCVGVRGISRCRRRSRHRCRRSNHRSHPCRRYQPCRRYHPCRRRCR